MRTCPRARVGRSSPTPGSRGGVLCDTGVDQRGTNVDARNLRVIGMLLVLACRGTAPAVDQVARSDSAVTARTWGLAYLQGNQLPQAEAEFRKVVALAPDQAVGYAELGLVYLREGRYREAEGQLHRAAALDSSNSDVAL